MSSDLKRTLDKATQKNTLKGLAHRDLEVVFSSMKSQVSQALPKHMTPERVIQMAINTVVKNQVIASCSAASIMGAIMQASALGFKPVDSLGQCYFVPYSGHVQFQIGYKGYIDLALRSGQIKMLYAEVVYEGDDFEYELGLYPKLRHKPSGDTPAGAEYGSGLKYAYAVVHYVNGGYNFVVINKNQIERLRLASPMQRGAASGSWSKWYPEMAKAKAIKQLSKYMPLSDEINEIIQTDERIITPENFSTNNSGKVKVEELDYEISVEEAEDVTVINPETASN